MREKIDSLSNRKIKDTAALATRRGRQKQGRFVAEGLRLGEMAAAAADAGWKTCYALYTADLASGERGAKLLDTLEAQGCPLYETADAAFRKACATESPQGILIVLEMKQNGLESLQNQGESAPFYVVLDGVQDPGNAGTIIRTADAAGAAGVLFTKGSVDVYEEKTVRATMGSLFHLPVVSGVTVDELASWAQEKGLQLLAAALDETTRPHFACDLTRPTAVVFGNEGNGVSAALLVRAQKVYIPMYGAAESLNVGTAAAIALYEAVRQRHFSA